MLTKSLKIDIDVVVKDNPCADASRLEWFAYYVNFALENNLIAKDSVGKCYPDKVLSRGQVADIIAKLIQLRKGE